MTVVHWIKVFGFKVWFTRSRRRITFIEVSR